MNGATTFRAEWSAKDSQYVGTCSAFPSMSHLADTAVEALLGIVRLAQSVAGEVGDEPAGLFGQIDAERQAAILAYAGPQDHGDPAWATFNAQHCRSCRHWRPFFTGEAWGVRSFIDAPAEAKAEITARLEASWKERDAYPDDWETDPPDGANLDAGWLDEVPGGPDWPEWGECARTELNHDATSLARAVDGSLYRAVLRTHGTFGCVQFEVVQD